MAELEQLFNEIAEYLKTPRQQREVEQMLEERNIPVYLRRSFGKFYTGIVRLQDDIDPIYRTLERDEPIHPFSLQGINNLRRLGINMTRAGVHGFQSGIYATFILGPQIGRYLYQQRRVRRETSQ